MGGRHRSFSRTAAAARAASDLQANPRRIPYKDPPTLGVCPPAHFAACQGFREGEPRICQPRYLDATRMLGPQIKITRNVLDDESRRARYRREERMKARRGHGRGRGRCGQRIRRGGGRRRDPRTSLHRLRCSARGGPGRRARRRPVASANGALAVYPREFQPLASLSRAAIARAASSCGRRRVSAASRCR